MVRRSCSQTTFVICFSAHKQWLDSSIIFAYQSKPESTKILIIYIIEEDFIIKLRLQYELTYYHKTKQTLFPWEFKMRIEI